MKVVLITGGARSGKSQFAQQLALKAGGRVLFVATAEAKDEDMHRRIEAHRQSRPENWETLEVPRGINGAFSQRAEKAETVVIDCITMLVANIMLQSQGEAPSEEPALSEIESLVGQMDRMAATFIIVTNEVGLGVVPESELGRRYRDCLGRANQLLARRADEVYLMVAGIPLRLK